MRESPVAAPGADLKRRAEQALAAYTRSALARWPQLAENRAHARWPWRTPVLRWYERGQAAGQAHWGECSIALSWPLALQAPQEALHDTLPHELAHIVAYRLAWPARIRPHGSEWQTVGRALTGRDLARTHSLDTSAVKARRTRYVLFIDPSDDSEVWITARRAKPAGRTFVNRRTGAVLVRTQRQRMR